MRQILLRLDIVSVLIATEELALFILGDRNLSNIHYTDDPVLMLNPEEILKDILQKVIRQRKKWLNVNCKKTEYKLGIILQTKKNINGLQISFETKRLEWQGNVLSECCSNDESEKFFD